MGSLSSILVLGSSETRSEWRFRGPNRCKRGHQWLVVVLRVGFGSIVRHVAGRGAGYVGGTWPRAAASGMLVYGWGVLAAGEGVDACGQDARVGETMGRRHGASTTAKPSSLDPDLESTSNEGAPQVSK